MKLPFVIGEFGSCHESRLGQAMQGVTVAAQAGCSAFKTQWVSAPARLAARRGIENPGVYKALEFPVAWHRELQAACHTVGIEYMCTAYLPEDLAVLDPFVQRFKVASFEATDLNFLADHGKYNKEVIISTGMVGGDQPLIIPPSLGKFKLLHCVSAYPTPIEQANIGACSLGFGYSDHTRNVNTGALAVAAGADILEVHFRLDITARKCPDYLVSLSPTELREYVRKARQAYVMRGSGVKEPQDCEKENMKYRVVG